MSGHFINIALDVLNVRNTRDLEVNERSPAFRKLESYFKKLTIKVAFGSVERKRTIRALIPEAGNYVFDKDGMTTKLTVRFLSSIILGNVTFDWSRTTLRRCTM